MNVQAENGGPGTYITASNFPVNQKRLEDVDPR